MYLECPQKYKFRYIDKLPEKPKHFFSFGKSLHTALEFFYNVTALPAPGLERVLEHYKARWVSEGYRDVRQEEEYFAEGRRILSEFHRKHIGDFQPPFFTEYRFDLEVDGVPVTGFVDRIDRIGPDRIAIVDYKTGKPFPGERVRTDAQLTLYQMACEELLGLKVERLTFYHLNSLTPHTAPPHDRERVQELRRRIVTVAASIRNGLFDPDPGERKCAWCDFKPSCPVFRGGQAATASSFPAGNGPLPVDSGDDLDFSALVDRYGRMMDELGRLRGRAAGLSDSIIGTMREKGWSRAFGSSYEAAVAVEERWEFRDKAKVLELIRKAGRWEDILAPSAPLVQKLMSDPGLPVGLRRQLEELGGRADCDILRCEPLRRDREELPIPLLSA